jgi:hypothetical protein
MDGGVVAPAPAPFSAELTTSPARHAGSPADFTHAGDLVGGLQDTTLDEPVVPDACLCAHANVCAGGAGVDDAGPKNSVHTKCGKCNCLRYAAEMCSVRIHCG